MVYLKVCITDLLEIAYSFVLEVVAPFNALKKHDRQTINCSECTTVHTV